MSNGDTRVDVSSEGEYHLKKAIEISLIYHTGLLNKEKPPSCHNYTLLDNAIWFGWGDFSDGRLTQFPARMEIDSLAAMTMAWLKDKAIYPEKPDIDGTCSRGWRLISHYDLMPSHQDQFYLNFGVRPVWMRYHK